MRIVSISDASFANALSGKIHLGFVISMVNKLNNANVVNVASSRCKRVARSVMATDIHGLGVVVAFDCVFVTAEMIAEMMDQKPLIEALVDSKTLFYFIAKDGKTAERRFCRFLYGR